MLGGLIAQLTLGFTAYFVILDERGVLQPSNFQVIVNSLHLIVAGLLLASAVSLTLIAARTGSLESVGAEDPHLEAAYGGVFLCLNPSTCLHHPLLPSQRPRWIRTPRLSSPRLRFSETPSRSQSLSSRIWSHPRHF